MIKIFLFAAFLTIYFSSVYCISPPCQYSQLLKRTICLTCDYIYGPCDGTYNAQCICRPFKTIKPPSTTKQTITNPITIKPIKTTKENPCLRNWFRCLFPY